MNSMNVGKLPKRKQFVLYVENGNIVRPLAYFVSEAAMREFLEWKPIVTDPYPKERIARRVNAT